MKKGKEVGLDKTDKNYTKKDAILRSIISGTSISTACEGADISRETFYTWQRTDERFKTALESSKDARINYIEDASFKTALDGNATMQIFLLCNLKPEKYKSINSTIHSFSKDMDESLERIAKILKN